MYSGFIMQLHTLAPAEADAHSAGLWAEMTPEEQALAEECAGQEEQLACSRRTIAQRAGSESDRSLARFNLSQSNPARANRWLAVAQRIDAAQHSAGLLAQLVIDFIRLMLAIAQPRRDEFLRPAPAPALAGRAIASLNLTPRVLAQRPITRRV